MDSDRLGFVIQIKILLDSRMIGNSSLSKLKFVVGVS